VQVDPEQTSRFDVISLIRSGGQVGPIRRLGPVHDITHKPTGLVVSDGKDEKCPSLQNRG